MHLVYLPANQAWAFLFGDAITSMYGEHIFHTRESAVDAAKHCGLAVLENGTVITPANEVACPHPTGPTFCA